MDYEAQLKLQAFLDGELPEGERREVAAWVARDAGATELLNELRNTRKALADFEPALKLPESREFYWSKIRREIDRLEPASEPATRSPWFASLRRILVPAGALAAVAAILIVGGRQSLVLRPSAGPDNEMTIADSGTFTYHDYANQTTLVWLSYPAER